MADVIDMQSVAPLRKVKRVQFGVLSPEEIKGLSRTAPHIAPHLAAGWQDADCSRPPAAHVAAMAVCEILYPETYEDGIPKPHGLCDARMVR